MTTFDLLKLIQDSSPSQKEGEHVSGPYTIRVEEDAILVHMDRTIVAVMAVAFDPPTNDNDMMKILEEFISAGLVVVLPSVGTVCGWTVGCGNRAMTTRVNLTTGVTPVCASCDEAASRMEKN